VLRFNRLDVLTAIVEMGLISVFYHPDGEAAKKTATACSVGGVCEAEFTKWGDFKPWMFGLKLQDSESSFLVKGSRTGLIERLYEGG
jgi:hypothetical protein